MKKISKSAVLTVLGAAILVAQLLGFRINAPYINEAMEAVCAVLILLGIVAAPKTETPNNNESEHSDTVISKQKTPEDNSGENEIKAKED